MTPRRLLVSCILCLSILYTLWHGDAAQKTATAAADERAAQQHLAQGLQAFQHGNFEQAEREWSAAATLHERARRPHAHSVVLTHLAQAYQALGQYRQALARLEKALTFARQSADRALLAAILGNLGNVYAVLGPAERSEAIFREALAITHELGNTALAAVIWNNLGNLYTSRKKPADALHAYKESIAFARQAAHQTMVVQALANAAMTTIGTQEYAEVHTLLGEALARAYELRHSHDKAYSLLNIGLTYRQLRSLLPADSEALLLLAFQAFNAASDVAQAIGDRRAASYAWGYLGALYEEERRYEEAWQLTQQAIFTAQQAHAPESLYRWQWQSGRLHTSQKNIDAAIAAYRQAIVTIQAIRPALHMSYGKAPAGFRESLGPVYFELVDLLLQRAAALPAREQSAPYLQEARDTVELFKAAELRDYFQDDCVDAAQRRTKPLDVVSQTAIIIYPILLPERLELLVSLPTGLTRVTVPVAAATVELVARRFRLALQDSTTQRYILHAQTLYDWLIRPLEALLTSVAVETLVFVPDGALRLIPMAALHDGQAFLIQKYALATTPGLDLTDPRALERHQQVLAVGVSKSVQGYTELPYASRELQAIVQI
jgi:tetratricopeptide (TPR) repeat protein